LGGVIITDTANVKTHLLESHILLIKNSVPGHLGLISDTVEKLLKKNISPRETDITLMIPNMLTIGPYAEKVKIKMGL
jgi:hypothetical protein